jgi:dCTP deaminase
MILSDVTLREAIAAGRIRIDPFDDSCVQPSSIDVRLDSMFRVFRNHTAGVIDVKQDMRDLTELVEIPADGVFMLHPGEFALGSTLERVAVPDDLVARIEGKSSLGRLGLLIHSSLPASETLLVLDRDGLVLRTIGQLVKEPREAKVVSFDPETFEIDYHDVTGFYEGPPDRIFEVRLASGRTVRVTAGHNLYTVDRLGELTKVRTGELEPSVLVAVPRIIPEPPSPSNAISVIDVMPESERDRLCIEGPTVARVLSESPSAVREVLQEAGYASTATYYMKRARLPWSAASAIPRLVDSLEANDRIGARGERHTLPAVIAVDAQVAWMIGMYVAEGYRRDGQIVISNTDQGRLDRLERSFERLGLPVYRSAGAVTCGSRLVSALFRGLGMGGKAPTKRIPPAAFGWSDDVLDALLQGLIDGDGRHDDVRTSLWTTSPGLVADVLLTFTRLGRRAGSCPRQRPGVLPSWQVYSPRREHKLLTSAPLPDALFRVLRAQAGWRQVEAAARLGFRNATDLNNIERRWNRDAVRLSTLRRFADCYSDAGIEQDEMRALTRLAHGDLRWDRVVEVVDTGCVEPIYDIEVRPGGRKVENFLAGSGGVFISNTAGFIDAGFDGHVTLELANVASLPITLYPGMKIGQISFMTMTTSAENPYGSGAKGSKYQGQRGPTPSRYFENFRDES